MGYIHCCGGLRKTRSFRLVPLQNFVLCELDYLKKCPRCGATSVQLTRIDKENNITTIRKSNSKALKFFENLKDKILYEDDIYDCAFNPHGTFYLYYNEYGKKKKCYSNLRNLKLGLKTLI